jgi:putative transcription antitermination factor YqgF
MMELAFLGDIFFPSRVFVGKKSSFLKRRIGEIDVKTRRCSSAGLVFPFQKSLLVASFIGRKAVGVDYGMNRVGVAVSVGFSPRPLTCIKHDNNNDLLLNKLREIVSSERAEIIVIGLPLSARGKYFFKSCLKTYTLNLVEYPSGQTQKAMDFAQLVANSFPKQQVYLCDEKYTSIVANERLAERGISAKNSKDLVDSEAAVVLLERFFGGWSTDETGTYLKLVKSQQEETSRGQDGMSEEKGNHPKYTPYREWRQNLLREQS